MGNFTLLTVQTIFFFVLDRHTKDTLCEVFISVSSNFHFPILFYMVRMWLGFSTRTDTIIVRLIQSLVYNCTYLSKVLTFFELDGSLVLLGFKNIGIIVSKHMYFFLTILTILFICIDINNKLCSCGERVIDDLDICCIHISSELIVMVGWTG